MPLPWEGEEMPAGLESLQPDLAKQSEQVGIFSAASAQVSMFMRNNLAANLVVRPLAKAALIGDVTGLEGSDNLDIGLPEDFESSGEFMPADKAKEIYQGRIGGELKTTRAWVNVRALQAKVNTEYNEMTAANTLSVYKGNFVTTPASALFGFTLEILDPAEAAIGFATFGVSRSLRIAKAFKGADASRKVARRMAELRERTGAMQRPITTTALFGGAANLAFTYPEHLIQNVGARAFSLDERAAPTMEDYRFNALIGATFGFVLHGGAVLGGSILRKRGAKRLAEHEARLRREGELEAKILGEGIFDKTDNLTDRAAMHGIKVDVDSMSAAERKKLISDLEIEEAKVLLAEAEVQRERGDNIRAFENATPETNTAMMDLNRAADNQGRVPLNGQWRRGLDDSVVQSQTRMVDLDTGDFMVNNIWFKSRESFYSAVTKWEGSDRAMSMLGLTKKTINELRNAVSKTEKDAILKRTFGDPKKMDGADFDVADVVAAADIDRIGLAKAGDDLTAPIADFDRAESVYHQRMTADLDQMGPDFTKDQATMRAHQEEFTAPQNSVYHDAESAAVATNAKEAFDSAAPDEMGAYQQQIDLFRDQLESTGADMTKIDAKAANLELMADESPRIMNMINDCIRGS